MSIRKAYLINIGHSDKRKKLNISHLKFKLRVSRNSTTLVYFVNYMLKN